MIFLNLDSETEREVGRLLRTLCYLKRSIKERERSIQNVEPEPEATAEVELEATAGVEAEATVPASSGGDPETPAGSDGSSGGTSRAAAEGNCELIKTIFKVSNFLNTLLHIMKNTYCLFQIKFITEYTNVQRVIITQILLKQFNYSN